MELEDDMKEETEEAEEGVGNGCGGADKSWLGLARGDKAGRPVAPARGKEERAVMKTRPAAEGKRWCPGIDTKLVAFLLTVPSLIVFLGGRNGEQPVVEIEAAMPGRARGKTTTKLAPVQYCVV
ncbi:hypothetical protein TRIUR3_01176 [Triticum urartu]|uniref:Uncharacterized protein n=1 Tax=Triticum urartu TaxID=4572 RepID=M7ZIT4_TRIUA|nr:hypothetical protein TRIUR3_01176 [Triticum urartu]